VFDRFRQDGGHVPRKDVGLGLGLSIARQLVQLHGGTIAAHSGGPGKGSTFIVRLPLPPSRQPAEPAAADGSRKDALTETATTGTGARQESFGRAEAAPTQATVSSPAQPTHSGALDGRRVLLVEDEPCTRMAVCEILRLRGAEVIAVGSADEALAAYERLRPTVIVSDIGLPGDDGNALIRRVREFETQFHAPRVPALALTAYTREQDREQSLSSGFQAHLAKPVNPDHLTSAILEFMPPTLRRDVPDDGFTFDGEVGVCHSGPTTARGA
jgi:CheY-like chemotaxis protein